MDIDRLVGKVVRNSSNGKGLERLDLIELSFAEQDYLHVVFECSFHFNRFLIINIQLLPYFSFCRQHSFPSKSLPMNIHKSVMGTTDVVLL